jgi:3-phenylpropionate/trans-cinnamate dioxygenase ferredoxin subunit
MPGFVRVSTVDEIPVGEVRTFVVDGTDIAVANVGGNFFALDDVCTHDGGPLGEGEVVGDTVECPRHGARFDVKTGRVRALPAVVPVRTYRVEVIDDEVRVKVDGP